MNAPPEPSGEPRRRHKRFVPRRAQVSVIPRGFWTSVVRRKNIAICLLDASLGGMRIASRCAVRTGQKTDLTVDFAGFLHPVQAEADVRWCRRDTMSLKPRWIVGLTLKHLSPEDEASLKDVDRTYVGVPLR